MFGCLYFIDTLCIYTFVSIFISTSTCLYIKDDELITISLILVQHYRIRSEFCSLCIYCSFLRYWETWLPIPICIYLFFFSLPDKSPTCGTILTLTRLIFNPDGNSTMVLFDNASYVKNNQDSSCSDTIPYHTIDLLLYTIEYNIHMIFIFYTHTHTPIAYSLQIYRHLTRFKS